MKWEYSEILVGPPKSSIQALNEVGQDRWECYSIEGFETQNGYTRKFYLKRPISEVGLG